MSYYAMFTDAGDQAVDQVLKTKLEDLKEKKKLPSADDMFGINRMIVSHVEDVVIFKGKGKVNPSKFPNDDGEVDDVKGFDEVTDTAVREHIYLTAQEYIKKHKK